MADYQYAFDSGVYAVTAMGNPHPLNTDVNSSGWGGTFPISAANNSFVLLSAGKINHEQVQGVLFTYQAAASSAPIAGDGNRFQLLSPGGLDHPDKQATSTVSITSENAMAPGLHSLSGSMLRLETVAGSLSTFIGIASGAALGAANTGSTAIPGSVFYSVTGTNREILESLRDVMNNGLHNNFEAAVHHRGHELSITQLSGGLLGNSVMFVSAGNNASYVLASLSSVIMINSTFAGGADEQGDATYIRAAAGTNASSAGYDGATVAVVTDTGRTVTYTLVHGGAVTPVISGFNLAVGPNMRRQVNMGMR